MRLNNHALKIFENNRNVDPQSHGTTSVESVPYEEFWEGYVSLFWERAVGIL